MTQKIVHGPQSVREHVINTYRCIRHKITGENERRLLFIACFPKSGSTYLMRLMHEISGFNRVHPTEARGANEHDFCASTLNKIYYQDAVCHQHVKATERNLSLLVEHSIKPVVLLRNIYDIIPSLLDHFKKESVHFPTGVVPDGFLSWEEPEQWRLIARLHIPWYFNFLLSWQKAEGQIPIKWLTYEELFADTKNAAKECLDFWNVDKSDKQIESAIMCLRNRDTRLNKGVSGRGMIIDESTRSIVDDIALSSGISDELLSKIGFSGIPVAAGIVKQ